MRRWRLLVGLGGIGFAGAALALATLLALRPLPTVLPPHPDDIRKAQITDRHGVALTVTYENDWNVHDRVQLFEIPQLLQQAFVHAEDRRFPQHHGIDWYARLHAVWQNLKAARAVRGASTISEQVVRMLHPRPRTLWSRWLEGWEAMQLEARFSKPDILEFYLNQAPYAGRRRGIVQAARHYFNRDLATLAPNEMLALAILVRSPSRFDLYTDPARLRPQLRRLADDMHTAGMLDDAAHKRILAAGFDLQPPALPAPVRQFAEHLFTSLPANELQRPTIVTTLDTHLQAQTHAIVDQWRQALAGHGVRNAAALVVDHRQGEVLAWVNAHADGVASAYDAVTVPRQPGSTLKPFLYAAAMERGWTAATIINDGPLSEAVGRGQHAYQNYSRTHYGPIRLRDALGNSLNIPAVRAAQFVGPAEFLVLLRDFGFDSLNRHPDHYGDGLALGNGEVTLLELVSAYAAIANDGRYRSLRVLRDELPRPPRQVLSRPVSHIIGNILSDPDARRLEFGTGGLMRFPVETAIKTGTSSDYRDAWAVAFNHRYTVGVWMGSLDGSPMQDISGSRGPVPAVRAVFAELNRRTEPQPLPMDESLVRAVICRDTGLPTDGECNSRPEWFLPDRGPELAAQTAVEPSPRIQQPSWNLQLAMDPRLPDEQERFAFRLDRLPEGASVVWVVDGDDVGEAGTADFLWPVRWGEHLVRARVVMEDGVVVETKEIPFRVR